MPNRTSEKKPAESTTAEKVREAWEELKARLYQPTQQKELEAEELRSAETKLETILSALWEPVAGPPGDVLKGSPSPQRKDLGLMDEEARDRLIKSALPMLFELAKLQPRTPVPMEPSAIEIELLQGLAEAEAADQKRGPRP